MEFPGEIVAAGNLKKATKQLKEYILDGFDIDYVIMLKKIKYSLDYVFKDEEIKEKILESHSDDQEYEWGGSIKIQDKGRYDFSKCGHTYYNQVIESIEELKIQKEALEKTMKGLPEPTIKNGKAKNVKVPLPMIHELKLSYKDTSDAANVSRPTKHSNMVPIFSFK